jgi:hypothetical protein
MRASFARFVLGAMLAIVLYPTLAGGRVTFTGFALSWVRR